MPLPTDWKTFTWTAWNSELSMEPDSRLFEGSKLEPELEESEESKDEGSFEVVMYPKPYCSRRASGTTGVDGIITMTPANPSSSMPANIPRHGRGEVDSRALSFMMSLLARRCTKIRCRRAH